MTEFLLISGLIISFINPADPTGTTMYPSGIKDCDDGFLLNPESPYPIIKISFKIFDNSYNEVFPGIYQVRLSNNLKTIQFYQANIKKAEFDIIKVNNLKSTKTLTSVETDNIDSELFVVKVKIADTEYIALAYKE